jgi:hypothetical protein
MEGVVTFPTDPQTAELMKPREGALHHPAQLPQPGPVLGRSVCDDRLGPATPQLAPVLVVVIATVSDDLIGPLTWAAALAADRSDTVSEGQQLGDVVAVPARQGDRERNPVRVDNQVMF